MIEKIGRVALALMIAGLCFYVLSVAWGIADKAVGLGNS